MGLSNMNGDTMTELEGGWSRFERETKSPVDLANVEGLLRQLGEG